MELYSGQNCQEVIRVKLSFWFNDIRFNWRICNVGIVAYLILTDTIVVFFTVVHKLIEQQSHFNFATLVLL